MISETGLFVTQVASSFDCSSSVSAQLRHSPYLADLASRFDAPGSLETILKEIPEASALELQTLKAKFSLAFARENFDNFDDAGRVWSNFADATIERALHIAWNEIAKKHRLKLNPDLIEGLFVLGLGKLGGNDLNFSSDIDLVAFFDPDRLPIPTAKGQAFICSDICKKLTQILHPRHNPDFIWRVDWRLRPESSGTGLAMSTTKAETFYFFRALPWHRLALMKARIVAGDRSAGNTFLQTVEPFIWRRNLDFTMIDELAALKTRINNEHPGLEYERIAPDPISASASGFNVKLGRGGIREIEFIANAHQLIYGGKHPKLRLTHTRSALSALGEHGFLPAPQITYLNEAYKYFRGIENLLQMFKNEQTHIVPPDPLKSEILVQLGTSDAIDADILEKRKTIHDMFSKLFSVEKSDDIWIDLNALAEPANSIAKHWVAGFTDHGLSPILSAQYKHLGQSLTARIHNHNKPDSFARIDNFLKQLGRSEQYFALLDRFPDLLDKLITPLLHSPHMTEILRQSPHIIDIFLTRNSESLADQSDFVLSSDNYERQLESLRRFVNEQLFLAYTKFLDGQSGHIKLQHDLTAIAETALNLSIEIVRRDLALDRIPITVLGLGRMGHSTMAPQSDLDLIFIFDNEIDTEISAKIVRRLRTTLTTKLREGIAYELDMRLRPSGRSGPPAVKLSAFHDHHMSRAHSWEHIALAPARIVAGDKSLGKDVMEIKDRVLTRARHKDSFLNDAWSMYSRIRDERIKETPANIWRCKLRSGGLMQADFLMSCYHVLGENPPKDLIETSKHWQNLQIWERLLGLTGHPISDTADRFSTRILSSNFEDWISSLENVVTSTAAELFDAVDKDKIAPPSPVNWA